jgi:uncharacterized protein YcfJ
MKKTVLLLTLAGTAGLSAAQNTPNEQELGRVLSSTPVINQVAVPRQVCSNESVPVQSQKSGAGAIVGAIAGGAVGNAIGGGNGRAAATFLGLLGGAVLGDRIEGPGPTQYGQVQNCATQTFYENRTTGYTVVYEYAGKQYSVLMPNDPGPYVKLQISPVSAAPSQPAPPVAQAPAEQQVIVQQPAPVYYSNQSYYQPYEQAPTYQAPVYQLPVYQQPTYQPYYRPYYPPVGVNLNFGWSSGSYYGHGHGHRY